MDNDSGEKGKRNSFPKWILIPILVAVVVVVILINRPVLENMIRSSVTSEEEYYQYVEKQNLEEQTTMLSTVYGGLIKLLSSKSRERVLTVDAKTGEKLWKLVEQASPYEASLTELQNLTAQLKLIPDDECLGIEGTAALSAKELFSLTGMLDTNQQLLYLKVPELDEEYIGIDSMEVVPDIRYATMQEKLVKCYSACPKKDKVNKVLKRYGEVLVSCMDHVKKGKEMITAGDQSEECTVLEVKIDEDTIIKILTALRTELSEDRELEDMIVKLLDGCEQDGDETYDEWMDGLNLDIKHAIEDLADDDISILMKVFVNKKGEICGRSFDVRTTIKEVYDDIDYNLLPEDYEPFQPSEMTKETSFTLSILKPQEGKQTGFLLQLKGEDMPSIRLIGNGTRKSGKLSGKYTLKVQGIDIVDIELLDAVFVNKTGLAFEGSYTISMTEMAAGLLRERFLTDVIEELDGVGLPVEELTLCMSSFETREGEGREFAIRCKEEPVVSIRLTSSEVSAGKRERPSLINTTILKNNSDLMEWLSEDKLEGFKTHLKEAGFPERILDILPFD